MKKILILHTSVGLGHKSLAENIGAALAREGFDVRLADIGQVQAGRFQRVVVGVHQFINKHLPFVWAWLYNWGHYLAYPFRVRIAGFQSDNTKILIDEYRPDLVISTQTSGSAVIAYLKQRGLYKNKFAIAFSDYHLHPYWLYPQADFYLANIREQVEEMVRRNIPPEKIYLCGMTLQPQPRVDILQVKRKLNIPETGAVVLVGSGSLGSGVDDSLIERLAAHAEWNILVVCGKNRKMYDSLTQKWVQKNVHILGYYVPMAELYAVSDIFLTKPGGLTVAEALSWKLPMIVTHWLPGQEKFNVKYLTARQVVLDGTGQDLPGMISRELAESELKKNLSRNPEVEKIVSFGEGVATAVKKELPVRG